MKRIALHRSTTVPNWVQLLAAAVVQQALCDACDPSLPTMVRQEARHFLAGNNGYRFWCQMSEGRCCNGHRRTNGRTVPVAVISKSKSPWLTASRTPGALGF